jgi:hypothetical protein
MTMDNHADVTVRAIAIGFLLTMTACGGGSSAKPGGSGGSNGSTGGVSGAVGGGGGSFSGTPVQQCNQLAKVICTRNAQCASAAASTTCEPVLNLEFGCDRAAGTDFSNCLGDTQLVSCSSLFPGGGLALPAACNDPLNAIPLSDAQNKCYTLVDELCARILQCAGQPATVANVQTCEDSLTSDVQTGLPCPLAVSSGVGYATCLAGLPTLACPSSGADGGADAAVVPAADGGMTMASIPACDTAITFGP